MARDDHLIVGKDWITWRIDSTSQYDVLQNAGFNDKNGREIQAENKSLHLHLPHKRMPQVDVYPLEFASHNKKIVVAITKSQSVLLFNS